MKTGFDMSKPMKRDEKQNGLYFLHGLDSSPQGTKARIIHNKYPRCLIPALPPDIHERLRILEGQITSPIKIVGSSLGGLTALMFADLHPRLVRAMLLMAPAVGCRDPGLFTPEQEMILNAVYVPAQIPTVIVAGKRDDLIPLDAIEAMVRRSPTPKFIRLLAVDDDHNLHLSLDLMMELLENMVSSSEDFVGQSTRLTNKENSNAQD